MRLKQSRGAEAHYTTTEREGRTWREHLNNEKEKSGRVSLFSKKSTKFAQRGENGNEKGNFHHLQTKGASPRSTTKVRGIGGRSAKVNAPSAQERNFERTSNGISEKKKKNLNRPSLRGGKGPPDLHRPRTTEKKGKHHVGGTTRR